MLHILLVRIIALRTSNSDSHIEFWENVVLVEAVSSEDALEKAKSFGNSEAELDDNLTVNDVRTVREFAGVRKLINISNPIGLDLDSQPPTTGTEITYSLFRAKNESVFKDYLAGRKAKLDYIE